MEPGARTKKLLNIIGLISVWTMMVFLVIHLFFNRNSGFRANDQLAKQLIELEEENQRLIQENNRLLQTMKYRQSDDYLEELARVEFRYVKRGEQLIFRSTPTPVLSETAPLKIND